MTSVLDAVLLPLLSLTTASMVYVPTDSVVPVRSYVQVSPAVDVGS